MTNIDASTFRDLVSGKLKKDITYKDWYSYPDGIKSNPIVIKDVVINGHIQLDGKLCDAIILENVTFTHTVKFGSCVFFELILEDVTFNGKATNAWESVGESLIIEKEADINQIKVRNGKFKHPVNIYGNRNASIYILGGIFENTLAFEGECTNLEFSGGTYFQGVRLGGAFIENLRIDGGSFNSEVSVNADRLNDLRIMGGTFAESFKCSKSAIQDLIINGGTFDSLFISNTKFIEQLKIGSVKVEGEFVIGNNRIGMVRFGDSQINKLKFFGRDHNSAQIRELQIQNSRRFFLETDNVRISKISLNNSILAKDSGIVISNTQVNSIEFRSCINLGIIHFHTVEPIKKSFEYSSEGEVEEKESPSTLLLRNSDLGKTFFINCDLSSIVNFFFSNTKISECFFGGTRLPDTVHTDPGQDHNEQKMLCYGQLKKAYENHGDIVQANRFFASEMESYYELLKHRPNHRWEIVNLWANRQSNRHGQSWGRAAITIILCGSILYLIYLVSLGVYPACPNGETLLNFLNFSLRFLEFINPVHKIDFLYEKEKLSDFSYFIDSVSRIISGYLIYQLVQAFRKYGKKI